MKDPCSIFVDEWLEECIKVIDAQRKYGMSLESSYHKKKEMITLGKEWGKE